MAKVEVDENLTNWNELSDKPWSALLIGNGSSCAIWDQFAYTSLYDRASSNEMAHPLTPGAVHIFESLRTRNFELVLSALKTTALVESALGRDTAEVDGLYQVTQNALIEAVHSVHIPWASVTEETLRSIRDALLIYKSIYSTNYDLLLYWAIMVDGGVGFKDYFWGSKFNISDTEIWDKATRVLFLHGALHLYRSLSGETIKRKAEPTQNLLDLFGTPLDDQFAVPLFITEGNSLDKLNSIYRSDYLSFAYSQFAQHRGPLVIFGHSLNTDFDGHLIGAIKHADAHILAISLLPEGDVRAKKLRFHAEFPDRDIHFFDAATHPLGSPKFRVGNPAVAI